MMPEGQRRLAHEPGLDGLRGMSLLAILFFHGGFGWATGAFLGVSTFFTLSGFLITSLVLAEFGTTGRVSLRRFYANRIRRLWPAAALTLVLITLYARFVAGPTQAIGFRSDLLASMLQVSNWWFILDGRSYGALFRAPSLVQHYWSLAVEEQFYLAAPPLLVLALRRGWELRKVALAVVALIGASAAVTIATAAGGLQADRIYYGTDTRAVEFLVGVLLAILVVGRPSLRPVVSRVIAVAAVVAFGIVLFLWGVSDQSDVGLYRGGLWAYSFLSAVLVLGCREAGPVRALLSWRPLRDVGGLSYTLYLTHWPIFLWLTPARLDQGLIVTFVARVALTFAVAIAMARLVERPIRSGILARSGRRWVTPAAAWSSVAVIVLTFAVVAPTDGNVFDIDEAAAQYARTASEVNETLPGAPRVGVFGDSMATSLSLGLATYARDTGRIALGPSVNQLGCGVLVEGGIEYAGDRREFGDRCEGREERYGAAASDIDVAVVLFSAWDVSNHRLPGDDQWRTVGDPVYDRTLVAEANDLIDLLTADGAIVQWILSPLFVGKVNGETPRDPFPESDPARMERFNDLVRGIARDRPDEVQLIDLPAWMRTLPGGELDSDLRPDGIHFPPDTALLVMHEFLADEIIEGARAR